ncbi:hypothetical protein RchiOBHm_Chr6g0258401 [Rosa chinensis]|uniref:Uncharacterized protein n=1 Tax=Rosa chinensis TaxID=74649 RepID=A0A2P6PMN7_ROSCH|nr:hypothetical protein RchiOBHm_Chr6g0258401 [Rosa chinensis]
MFESIQTSDRVVIDRLNLCLFMENLNSSSDISFLTSFNWYCMLLISC